VIVIKTCAPSKCYSSDT